MNGLNTIDLECIANSHSKLKIYFHGVYALDQLPRAVYSYPTAFIINTHPISKSGEHWVAIYLDGKCKGTYFDSYGFPPTNSKIIKFLKTNTSTWTYSQKVLQFPISFLCGGYCIYFLVKKCQGHSLKSILSNFKSDLQLNDVKINRFLRRTFAIRL